MLGRCSNWDEYGSMHFHDDWACDSSLLCAWQFKVRDMKNSVG